MSKYIIDGSTLTDIADAIREESTWTSSPIPTENMANEIRDLQNGYLETRENGTFNVKGIGTVDINVPQGVFPSGDIEITENGTHDVTNFVNAIVNVTGGGLPDNFLYQKVIIEEDTYTYTVNHNKGVTPYWAAMMVADINNHVPTQEMMCVVFEEATSRAQSYTNTANNISTITVSNFTYPPELTDDHVTFGGRYPFRAGYEYHIIIVF